MSDGWTSVDIRVPEDADETKQEILSAALFEVGAAGIETRDDQKPVLLIASFPPEVGADELPPLIEAALEAAAIEPVSVELRAEAPVDWATHWRRHFQPLGFGELWVVPTWLEPPAEAKHVLRLDPGTAFGTGSHATTALCLERIVALAPPGAVLDVGTGTGILAMGALARGASRAVGTDEDPEALAVAAENAALNGLADRLQLTDAAPDAQGTFELVVANILRDPLIALAAPISRAVAPGGVLLLSGILGTQVEDVARAYEAQGLGGRKVANRGEWAMLELSRGGS